MTAWRPLPDGTTSLSAARGGDHRTGRARGAPSGSRRAYRVPPRVGVPGHQRQVEPSGVPNGMRGSGRSHPAMKSARKAKAHRTARRRWAQAQGPADLGPDRGGAGGRRRRGPDRPSHHPQADRALRPQHPARRAPAGLAALTPRELGVLTPVARGRSNAEIAAELVLSDATVKTHVKRCCVSSACSTASRRWSSPTRSVWSAPVADNCRQGSRRTGPRSTPTADSC